MCGERRVALVVGIKKHAAQARSRGARANGHIVTRSMTPHREPVLFPKAPTRGFFEGSSFPHIAPALGLVGQMLGSANAGEPMLTERRLEQAGAPREAGITFGEEEVILLENL